MVDLDKDVKYVKGVGPQKVKLLNKLDIYFKRPYNILS